MATCPQVFPSNCTDPNLNITLQPNPDISGVGVLASFGASAFITLILCTAYYLIDHENNPNPVDRLCIESLPALWGRRGSKPSARWGQALQSVVLAFGDQQIVTSIAILVSGYSQFACGLAVYHWQITVDLAWFSSITHLTTLTCLRRYFQDRPALRLWRIVFMGITAVLLVSALASTGYMQGNYVIPNTLPAQCLYHPDLMSQFAGGNAGSTIYPTSNGLHDRPIIGLTMTFLIISYLSRIIQLFPAALDKTRDTFRTRPSKALKGLLATLKTRASLSSKRSTRTFWVITFKLVMSIFCLLKAAFDVYGSSLWEITWLSGALFWGTILILLNRSKVPGYSGLAADNIWGFGQVLAVSLLMLPFLYFLEIIYDSVFSKPGSGASALHNPQSITTLQSSTPSIEGLYTHRWFRKLTLLMCLLSLSGMTDIVFDLSFGDWDLIFMVPSGKKTIANKYGTWSAVNLALVWLFTLICLLLPDNEPALIPTGRRPSTNFLQFPIPESARRWIYTFAWNSVVLILAAGSAAYIWLWGPGYDEF